MGSWFDAVADAFQLPRPPRVSWEEAEQRIAPLLLSFMSESRRLVERADEARAARAPPVSDAAAAARRDRAARPEEAAGAAAVSGMRDATPTAGGRTPAAHARGGRSARLDAYERLVRLDKPIGIAAAAVADAVRAVARRARRAAVVARADLHDGHDPDALGRLRGQRLGGPPFRRRTSQRTAERPLATGEIAPWEALAVAAALAFCAFLLVLATNRTTILLSLPAVAIAFVYPFFKRFFALPQAFLGIAFSFGIPMAYAAVYDACRRIAWWLLAAQPVLGHRLRHRVRDGRPRRRPAARPAHVGDRLRALRRARR